MQGGAASLGVPRELLARAKRPVSPSSVPGSLPVLFFGDLLTAKVASVGLNPSKQEYLTSSGHELAGSARRFETLGSLGSHERASLTDKQCARAIETMRAYFRPGKPIYGWFRALDRVLESMGYRYEKGEAAHLDLVQEATDPTWSALKSQRPNEADALLETDLPFLLWEIETFPIEAIVCNGRTAFDTLSRRLGASIDQAGALARVKWYAGSASVGSRAVRIFGWNIPLARATGLGADGERELGRLFASQLDRGVSPPQSDSKAADVGGDTNGNGETTGQVEYKGTTYTSVRQAARAGVPMHRIAEAFALTVQEVQLVRIDLGLLPADSPMGRHNVERVERDRARNRQAAPSKAIRGLLASPLTEWNGQVTRDELLRMVETRRGEVRRFLDWASRMEAEGESLRWDARGDIEDARAVAHLFAEPWWGVVVFTAFGSLQAAKTVSGAFKSPIRASQARDLLEGLTFTRGSVGHHRIRPGLTGAKTALVSACERAAEFEEILIRGDGFRDRYQELRELRATQWGRTTCFDLVLRAGALGIGGRRYPPDQAYLDGSTGPRSGFEQVWGIAVSRENAARCEALLTAWTENWAVVAEEAGSKWAGPPYVPGDFENALCVYQER